MHKNNIKMGNVKVLQSQLDHYFGRFFSQLDLLFFNKGTSKESAKKKKWSSHSVKNDMALQYKAYTLGYPLADMIILVI